jgi:hypothetical protein
VIGKSLIIPKVFYPKYLESLDISKFSLSLIEPEITGLNVQISIQGEGSSCENQTVLTNGQVSNSDQRT